MIEVVEVFQAIIVVWVGTCAYRSAELVVVDECCVRPVEGKPLVCGGVGGVSIDVNLV